MCIKDLDFFAEIKKWFVAMTNHFLLGHNVVCLLQSVKVAQYQIAAIVAQMHTFASRFTAFRAYPPVRIR